MKPITALHILVTVVVPAKLEEARTNGERGGEALTFAIITAGVIAVALLVLNAYNGAAASYVGQIHG